MSTTLILRRCRFGPRLPEDIDEARELEREPRGRVVSGTGNDMVLVVRSTTELERFLLNAIEEGRLQLRDTVTRSHVALLCWHQFVNVEVCPL